jgi:tetratricopeptide (TPR) repeat protein
VTRAPSLLARLLCVALLATPGVATAAKKPPEAPAPPPSTLPVPEGVKPEDHAKVFAEYEAQVASGQKSRAADALVVILDDPARAAFHAEAYALLGDILAQLDLSYGALLAYASAFDLAGPTDTAIIGTRVPKAIELANKVGDTAALEKPFSKNVGLAQTEDVRGQMAFLAAREAVRTGSYGLAMGVLKMVKPGDPLYPDARSLEGIAMNQQGRPVDALTPLLDAQKSARAKDQRFQDMLALNLGRSYYAAGNFAKAIQSYAAVSRGSDFWPQAQFERSWAHFRIDDMNGALGLLLSLDTPFFTDYYYPEADLLRIYSMFMMCKFPEANNAIDAFKANYSGVHTALKGWTGKSPEEAFAAARLYREKGDTSGLPAMLLRPYQHEERFGASIAAVDSAQDELDRMKNAAANPFTEKARSWVQARRDALVAAEGGRIRDRLVAQEQELNDMLSSSDLFTVDILRMKTLLYEQAAAIGRMPDSATTVKREERARKGWREWPYEGEIWADEIGYYRVSALPECPAGLRQAVTGGK